jgi:hypothetical protein
MKLQSKTDSMMVDFYPIKTPMGNVSEVWVLKTMTFEGKTLSKTFLNRIEMRLEVDEYLNNDSIPYEVVDFNTTPQLANPFAEV